MLTKEKPGSIQGSGAATWILPTAIVLGIGLPLGGTLTLASLLPAWSLLSLSLHSTMEVGGATLGIVLAIIILFLQQKAAAHTSRRMWAACALISMAVLDISHSCVPVGNSFVWLHSLAVLAGGVFFAIVWFPDLKISRATLLAVMGTVLLVTVLLGLFSGLYPQGVPVMIVEDSFTPMANAINLIGGGLTLLAALNFALSFYESRNREELLFLLICLLFGGAGVLFSLSDAWEAAWWFWHILRFAAYLFAFWLAMLLFRSSQDEMLRAHGELDSLFHKSIDGKRVIDLDFNQLRTNDMFALLFGVNTEVANKMKCYDVLPGPLCHTDECPVKHFETGTTDKIHREIKTGRDGKEAVCILNAVRLNAADGSFRGVIESFWDITDRKEAEDKLSQQASQKTAQAELAALMRGNFGTEDLCRNIITFLCKYLHAQTGVMFLVDMQGTLKLAATYAHKRRKHLANEYKPGEGLVGQAALEREDIILTNVPGDYIIIESGLGEIVPRNIYVKPVILNDKVVAVIELGTLEAFTDSHSQFLNMVTENIAIAIDSAKGRTQLGQALERTQAQTEELQAQQEELRATNEELEEKTEGLQASEAHLKVQEEELRAANAELEEKAQALEERQEMVSLKNRELLEIKTDLEEKARQLQISGKYKSEFLANMSHELRTPLNSVIILAQDLARNKAKNLTAEQIKDAEIIKSGGEELLQLIQDILDLSKIEAGRMPVNIERVPLAATLDSVMSGFKALCAEKGLELTGTIPDGLPDTIRTDRQKLEQVLRNLLSNAFKFTEKGNIALAVATPREDTDLSGSGLTPENALVFSVADTGIGISQDQQGQIFEAFHQADGSTSRSYGGTGLGLSISRELTKLLGGELRLESAAGKGAVFSVYLPREFEPSRKNETGDRHPEPGQKRIRKAPETASILFSAAPDQQLPAPIPDDREAVTPGDKVVCVIEDDESFARVLQRACHERDFKCIHAADGKSGLALVRQYKPDAVILDIRMPGMDGWSVLDAIKTDSEIRHIPVHIMSVEEETLDAYRKGAIGFLTKPANRSQLDRAFARIEDLVQKKVKKLLVVEDDPVMQKDIIALIGNGDVLIKAVDTGSAAIEEIRGQTYDCIILDLKLPDMSGFEILRRLDESDVTAIPPVVIYTGRELTHQEVFELQQYTTSIIVKGVRSRERLLDETALFLHRVVDKLPPEKQEMIARIYEGDTAFTDRHILVVDDDMRNLYAISKILMARGMRVFKAVNGKKALEILDEHPEVDLVLMDIMMPVMDGYEAIRCIREQDRFHKLPIIAVTAKAMKEDRERCIAAGADDYLSKPVEIERLLSLMRVWLIK